MCFFSYFLKSLLSGYAALSIYNISPTNQGLKCERLTVLKGYALCLGF